MQDNWSKVHTIQIYSLDLSDKMFINQKFRKTILRADKSIKSECILKKISFKLHEPYNLNDNRFN